MAIVGDIAAIRDFNRFYTRQIGLLEEGHLKSPYTLGQARLIYEIGTTRAVSASDLSRRLGMDAGLVSRMLKGLEAEGLVARSASRADRRRSELSLTEMGRTAFSALDDASSQAVSAWLAPLPDHRKTALLAAMQEIRRQIEGPDANAPFVLRDPKVGDLAFVAHRQAVLYAREHGFDWTYEALVCEIVASFTRSFDRTCERCWIAERDGETVGSVFVVKQSETVARLRLLYVDPAARGLGLGRRLVAEAVRFATECGYGKMTLWTNDILLSARRLYEAAGFVLVEQEKHRSFGRDLVGQTWDLALPSGPKQHRAMPERRGGAPV